MICSLNIQRWHWWWSFNMLCQYHFWIINYKIKEVVARTPRVVRKGFFCCDTAKRKEKHCPATSFLHFCFLFNMNSLQQSWCVHFKWIGFVLKKAGDGQPLLKSLSDYSIKQASETLGHANCTAALLRYITLMTTPHSVSVKDVSGPNKGLLESAVKKSDMPFGPLLTWH